MQSHAFYMLEMSQVHPLLSISTSGTLIQMTILFHPNYYSESESCSVMSDSFRPHGLYSPWNSPGQNTGVGSLSPLQGIFPTHWHCRWILYQLSHKGSPLSLWLLDFYLLFTYFQPPTLSCRVCPTYSNFLFNIC